MRMITSRIRTARYTLLLALGVVIGLVVMSVAAASGNKSSLWSKVVSFAAPAHGPVADNQCAVPKDTSNDVYFVSCGGFF